VSDGPADPRDLGEQPLAKVLPLPLRRARAHSRATPERDDDQAAIAMVEEPVTHLADPLDPAETAPPHHPHAPHLPVSEVKRRALKGIVALTGRTLGTRIFAFAGNVILARLLLPRTFGLFAIVNFIVAIASFLADLGIGAALVQRKEELTEEDLRTAFTLGVLIDIAFTLAVMALAPVLVKLYHLEPRYVLAIRGLALTIMASSFAAIPSIKLERTLQFARVTAADVVSQFTYIAIAVIMAFAGYHVWALVVASIASRTIGSAMLNVMAWWRPRLGMTRASLRRLLVFGLPYQANGIVIQIKDNFVPTFVAFVGGATAVGYLNFAINLAGTPMFAVTIVSRITFATYSRLQHDSEALRRAIEESIRWISAVVFPVTLLLMALAPQIIHYVYTPKWRPSLAAFYFMCVPVLASSYSTVLVSALYGLGRAKQVLKLTIIWTIAGWGLAIPFTLWLGFTGFAAAMACVSLLSLLTVREINKIMPIRFVRTSLRLLSMAAVPAFGAWAAAPHVVHGFLSLAALAISGMGAYAALLFVTGELRGARNLLKVVMQRD
jgi:PST family polysaccharide transporter